MWRSYHQHERHSREKSKRSNASTTSRQHKHTHDSVIKTTITVLCCFCVFVCELKKRSSLLENGILNEILPPAALGMGDWNTHTICVPYFCIAQSQQKQRQWQQQHRRKSIGGRQDAARTGGKYIGQNSSMTRPASCRCSVRWRHGLCVVMRANDNPYPSRSWIENYTHYVHDDLVRTDDDVVYRTEKENASKLQCTSLTHFASSFSSSPRTLNSVAFCEVYSLCWSECRYPRNDVRTFSVIHPESDRFWCKPPDPCGRFPLACDCIRWTSRCRYRETANRKKLENEIL